MQFRICLTLLLLLLGLHNAVATSRLQLAQAGFDSLQQSINLLTDSLTQLSRTEDNQLLQLDALQRRLNLSHRLLDEAATQVDFLETDLQRITSEQDKLSGLEVTIRKQYDAAVLRRDTLQQRFRQIVRKLYMALPLPLGEQLLASEDISSLVRRHTFLRSLNRSVVDRRAQLSNEIVRTNLLADSLQRVALELTALKHSHTINLTNQRELRELQTERVQSLETDRTEYRVTLARLQEDKQQWQAYLYQRQQAQQTIEQKLQLYRRAAANRESALTDRATERDYAESRLGNPATANHPVQVETSIKPGSLIRGKTPWPVKGNISRHFGVHQDQASGTSLDNPGIDFRSDGASVRSVAAGKVLEITWLPGFGQTILLEHADGYFTVYAGLETVTVTPAQYISRLHQLGDSGQKLHFEIWRERQRLDPEKYLTISY
jgi:murein hydrolase activator